LEFRRQKPRPWFGPELPCTQHMPGKSTQDLLRFFRNFKGYSFRIFHQKQKEGIGMQLTYLLPGSGCVSLFCQCNHQLAVTWCITPTQTLPPPLKYPRPSLYRPSLVEFFNFLLQKH
jgi:hypothetical protein